MTPAISIPAGYDAMSGTPDLPEMGSRGKMTYETQPTPQETIVINGISYTAQEIVKIRGFAELIGEIAPNGPVEEQARVIDQILENFPLIRELILTVLNNKRRTQQAGGSAA